MVAHSNIDDEGGSPRPLSEPGEAEGSSTTYGPNKIGPESGDSDSSDDHTASPYRLPADQVDQTAERPQSGPEQVEHEKDVGPRPQGRHHKEWAFLPLITIPRGENGEWLAHDQRSKRWLSLFFDLAVVGILAVFTSEHEIATPSQIPLFVSYFVVIQWAWVSVTYYDVRFQGEDNLHRVFTCAHIILFVYLGAVSENWDLAKLRDVDIFSDKISDKQYIDSLLAQQSFFTLFLALIIIRAVLAVQYIISWRIAVKTGRNHKLQIIHVGTLILCIALNIAGLVVPTDTAGKVAAAITLQYSSIVVEMVVMMIVQACKGIRYPLDVPHFAKRTGELTLIILGESGFSSLTKAFNLAIGGFSDSDKATYAQVFLSIGIIVMTYLFIFSWFNPEEAVSGSRAVIWQAIHYPLHLGILLLCSAVVNNVVVISYVHGINTAAEGFAAAVSNSVSGTDLSGREFTMIFKYLERLPLQPDLTDLYNQTIINPQATTLVYFGQVLVKTTEFYGIKLGDEPTSIYAKLNAVNTTMNGNTTLGGTQNEQASEVFSELFSAMVSEALSGTLWLFPCAGFVLIVASIRSALWYRLGGASHYLIHGGMIVSGLILGCLGFLDFGRTKVVVDITYDGYFRDLDKVAPMYNLVGNYVPLVIVLGVYALTYWLISFTLYLAKKRRNKRFARNRASASAPALLESTVAGKTKEKDL